MNSRVLQAVFILALLGGHEVALVGAARTSGLALEAVGQEVSMHQGVAAEENADGTALVEQLEEDSFDSAGEEEEGANPPRRGRRIGGPLGRGPRRPVVVVRPRPRPIFRPGMIVATAAAAAAAGAIIASTSKPARPPRGNAVIVTMPAQPVYINDPSGRMMQVTVVAPVWCNPCMNEPMQINVGGPSYFVTTPPQIFAGQTFIAIVPVMQQVYVAPRPQPPVIPDVIMSPIFVSEVDFIRTMQVSVPATHGPGMMVKVKMPEGDIRKMQIPAGAFHPNFFTFTYNPTAEAEARKQKEIKKTLNDKYRCCCQEVDGACLWFPNSILKSGPRCSRIQERGELPRCARDFCGPFGSKGCSETHHGQGQCKYTMDDKHHFKGGKC